MCVLLGRVINYDPQYPRHFKFTNWIVAREIIKAITAILSLICDIAIMISILHLKKFKKLRYFYIFHFCLLHIIYCLNNFYVVFFDYTEIKGYYPEPRPNNDGVYYGKKMKIAEDLLILLIFFVSLLLIVDFFIKVTWTKIYNFYRSINFVMKYFFYTSLPVLALAYFITPETIRHLKILNIFASFICILTVISYILSCAKKLKCKSNSTLFVSTILSLSFLPYMILQNIEKSIEKQSIIINYFFADCEIFLATFFVLICFILNKKKVGQVILDRIIRYGKCW